MLSTPPAFILSQDQTLMLKVLIQPEDLAFQIRNKFRFTVLRFALLKAVRSSFDDLNYTRRTLFVMNLSRLFTVQLSMFSVVFSNSDMLSHLQVFVNNFFIFLFQFFRTDVLSFCDSFNILSNLFRFVKNFFHFLFRSDSVLCDSLIILSNRCSFVKHFFIFLNSVLSSLSCDSLIILSKCFSFVKNFFHFLLYLCFKAKESAGGGIRTHAPLRTNGFQDRLVMTTSIPLRVTINT